MKSIQHYKQASGQGCLVACLYFVAKIPCSVELEKQVLMGGLFLERNSYALAVVQAFLLENPRLGPKPLKIRMLVTNHYHARELQA